MHALPAMSSEAMSGAKLAAHILEGLKVLTGGRILLAVARGFQKVWGPKMTPNSRIHDLVVPLASVLCKSSTQ